MFNHTGSQLFSPRSLYVSQNHFRSKKKPALSYSLNCEDDYFIYFIVSRQNHYASVRIRVSPFQLEKHPGQLFYSSTATYKLCCQNAKAVDFHDTLRKTAQSVYSSTFSLQTWDFSNDHCWSEEQAEVLSSNINQSCLCSAVENVANYDTCNREASQIVVASNEDNTHPANHGKRVRDAIDQGLAERKRLCSMQATAINETQVSTDYLSDVLKPGQGEDVVEYFRDLLQREARAVQMANLFRYLGTCLVIIHAESQGIGPKKTQEMFNGELKRAGIATSRTTSWRRRQETTLISMIIASMPDGKISGVSMWLLFGDKVYAMIRQSSRAENTTFVDWRKLAYVIVRELSNLQATDKTHIPVDLLSFFESLFPRVGRPKICDAIKFKAIWNTDYMGESSSLDALSKPSQSTELQENSTPILEREQEPQLPTPLPTTDEPELPLELGFGDTLPPFDLASFDILPIFDLASNPTADILPTFDLAFNPAADLLSHPSSDML